MSRHARCLDCGREHETDQLPDDALCSFCRSYYEGMYANDPVPDVDEDRPRWKYSKAAMRERLGVTGDRDE